MSHGCRQILAGLVLWASVTVARGEPAQAPGKTPPFTVTETEIKLPGVTINRATREFRIEATACLESGILEYVVCRPNTFEHEAIFTTEAKPELVHAALLLCGLNPTPQLRGLTELWWDKAMEKEESRVTIEVEWQEEGNQKRVNLTSMLRSREDWAAATDRPDPEKDRKEPEVQDAWVFAGSFIQGNRETGERIYAANLSGILVGIWPDPSTVIQYGIASGNPYEGKDLGMEINTEQVPRTGTKVHLVFSRHTPPEEQGEGAEK